MTFQWECDFSSVFQPPEKSNSYSSVISIPLRGPVFLFPSFYMKAHFVMTSNSEITS